MKKGLKSLLICHRKIALKRSLVDYTGCPRKNAPYSKVGSLLTKEHFLGHPVYLGFTLFFPIDIEIVNNQVADL